MTTVTKSPTTEHEHEGQNRHHRPQVSQSSINPQFQIQTTVTMNSPAICKLVDFFAASAAAGVEIDKSNYALWKQLEGIVGEGEFNHH